MSTVRTLNGDEVMKVQRLGSWENFVGKCNINFHFLVLFL